MICTPAPAEGTGPPPKARPAFGGDNSFCPAWPRYDLQEDKEPFDAAKELAQGLPPRLLDPDRRIELGVQACVRIAKMYSENLGSTAPEFLAKVPRPIPAPAVAHCLSRYADGRTSLLLKWHYCLVLHLATGRREWLARAIALMLQSADGTADNRRASSYIITAYNLDRWHRCGLRDAVLASALRFIRQRPHSAFAYKCAIIIADLAGDPRIRAAVRGAMIRAAQASSYLDASHCLRAAGLLAGGQGG